MNGIYPTNPPLSSSASPQSTNPAGLLPLFLSILCEKLGDGRRVSGAPHIFQEISPSDLKKYQEVFGHSLDQSKEVHSSCASDEFALEEVLIKKSFQREAMEEIKKFTPFDFSQSADSFYENGPAEDILSNISSFHTLLESGSDQALGNYINSLIFAGKNVRSRQERTMLAMNFFSICNQIPFLSTFINSLPGDIKQSEKTLILLIGSHPILYKLPPEIKKVFTDAYFDLIDPASVIRKREFFTQAINDTLPALFPTSDPYIGNAITSGVQDYGSVALLTSNAFLTVYASPGSSSNTELRASHWFINGSYVDDFTIDTHSSLKQNTVVLTLSDGNVLIAWDRRSDGSTSTSSRGAIYNVESDRVGNSFSLLTASSGSFVSLAAKPSGYTVAFTTVVGGDSVGQYQEFTGSNIPVGNRINLGYTTAAVDFPPQIFPFNGDDHRIALWTDGRNGVQEIRGQVVRRSDSSFLGDTFYINPELMGNQTLLGMQPLLAGNGAVLVESDGEIFLTIIAPPLSPNEDPTIEVVNGPVSVFEGGGEYYNGQLAVSSEGIAVIAQCDRGVCIRLMKCGGDPMGATFIVTSDAQATNPHITFEGKELVACWEIQDPEEGNVFVRSIRLNTSPVPTNPIPPATVDEEETAAIPVPAEEHFFDADGHKMTLRAYGEGQTDLPSFVTFNSDREEFILQPGLETNGNYTFYVQADDGYYGVPAQQEFFLTVRTVETSKSGLGVGAIVGIVSGAALLAVGVFFAAGGHKWIQRKVEGYTAVRDQ